MKENKMPHFMFATACNKPRLRDPTKARDIIGRYRFDWDLSVEIETDTNGEHRLTIHGEGWPGAWRIPPECKPDEFEPNFAGISDFEGLLEELAPCLADPLIVQAIGTVTGLFPLLANEWSISPGSRLIQRRDFSANDQGTAKSLQLSAL
jgi:hypothetical protein